MAERERLNRRERDDDRDRGRGRERERDDDRGRRSSRDREDDDRGRRGGGRERERARDDRGGGRSRGGGRFTYQRRDAGDLRKRAEQTGGSFDSIFNKAVDTFKPKVGSNTVRFIPPTWENAKHYGYDIFVHSYVGADESTYLCPRKMLNKECPICEAWEDARKSGDQDEEKALKPTQRVLCYVVDRDGDEAKPLVWNMSWSQDRDIAALADTRQGALWIDDPEEGYDVTFQRKGQQLNTRYFGTQIDRQSSPLVEKQRDQDSLLDDVQETPLPSLLKFYPVEHLEKVISGKSMRSDEDLDDDRGRGRERDADDYESEEDRYGRRGRDDDREERGRGRDRDEEEAPRSRRGRDEEEDRSERRRGSRDREDDREERPARGRREEEDEPRGRGRSSRDRDEEEPERPARGSRDSRDRDEERPRSRDRDRDSEPRDEREPDEPEAEEAPEDDERPARGRRRR